MDSVLVVAGCRRMRRILFHDVSFVHLEVDLNSRCFDLMRIRVNQLQGNLGCDQLYHTRLNGTLGKHSSCNPATVKCFVQVTVLCGIRECDYTGIVDSRLHK